MSVGGDVNFSTRADSSQLETDLNTAVNRVYHAADKADKSIDKIGNSAGRAASKSVDELSEVNKLLEKDSKNTALCAQKKELLKKAIAETSDKLKSLKDRQADVNQAYKNGDIPDEEYREFQREVAATEQELRNYREELNNVGKASDEAADKTENKLSGAFGRIGKAVGTAVAAVAAGAAAVGTAAVRSADSLDKAVKRVTTATGEGEEAAEKYAEVISNVYGDNFGENFEDIAATISTITQNLGEMNAEPLEKITESAYALQDAFDMDAAETARAAKAMVENFGIAAEDAFDYIAKGAQDGLNYSGELVDNISEYSVQFKKLGLSADDMFTIFANGAENGAWNLDKIGDAVKEFSIRAIDGSDTTKKGFEALGYDAEDMAKKFSQGGDVARDAFQTIIKALGDMEDPIAQNEAGVNLFGTMWEDLGVDAVKALGDISDSAYDCAGAVGEIVEVNYSSLSDALGGLQRQVELLIQPLGDKLIPVVSDVIDGLSEMADEVIPELLNAITPVIENITPLIEPLMELIASVLPQLVELVSPIIEMLSGLIQTVLPPLTELIGGSLLPMFVELAEWFEESMFPIIEQLIEWLTDSFMPVLEKVLNELFPPMMEVLEALAPLMQTLLDILLPILDLVLRLIDPILQLVSGALAPLITELLSLINDILTPLMPLIQAVAEVVTQRLGSAISGLTSIVGTVAEYFTNVFRNIRTTFSGIVDFITGVFTGNWEKAWKGVEKIFSGIWNNIKSVAELVVNGIIDLLNNFVSGINNLFGWLGVQIEPLKHVDFTADDAEEQAKEAVGNYNIRSSGGGSSWYADYYRSGANLPTDKQVAALNAADQTRLSAQKTYSVEPVTYKPYTPTADTSKISTSTSTAGTSSGSSGDKGNFISITSYVPTMWDSDQTAALKSLIGRDVLGKTTSAHQINALTGAISGAAESTSASKETDLADVINAITRLQRKVEKFEDAFGDMTIELTAGDLTIGRACVRDCNIMAKRSGKSPFNF